MFQLKATSQHLNQWSFKIFGLSHVQKVLFFSSPNTALCLHQQDLKQEKKLARTRLTLCLCSLLTGQSWCARLADAFAFISVHDSQAIVPAGPAVAGIALRPVLLNGPAEVELLQAGTLNLLHQLRQQPQLRDQERKGYDSNRRETCC